MYLYTSKQIPHSLIPSRQAWYSRMIGIGSGIMTSVCDNPLQLHDKVIWKGCIVTMKLHGYIVSWMYTYFSLGGVMWKSFHLFNSSLHWKICSPVNKLLVSISLVHCKSKRQHQWHLKRALKTCPFCNYSSIIISALFNRHMQYLHNRVEYPRTSAHATPTGRRKPSQKISKAVPFTDE